MSEHEGMDIETAKFAGLYFDNEATARAQADSMVSALDYNMTWAVTDYGWLSMFAGAEYSINIDERVVTNVVSGRKQTIAFTNAEVFDALVAAVAERFPRS